MTVELNGMVLFPRIGELLYLVSVRGEVFMWFCLKEGVVELATSTTY